ncbi:MAG: hypothetical protein K9G76_07430 [Bacteroidales bacterium]|nr:hypothetical protein [Bacteroidales bacterium]MCF8405904.1 hypothetical protein [Bacteroidales bacterium]
MKRFKTTLILVCISLNVVNLSGQVYNANFNTTGAHNMQKLSPADSIVLAHLPILTPAVSLEKLELPYQVDNSEQPYFRPLFEQQTIECGQYSGIAFNFSYEMNYTRNTSASLPENQYPTHYTYNFMNGGFGWQGVSYFHSWEIAKTNGHPNLADYGGNNPGGVSMWMTGYDKYYQGMFNKLDEVYQIHTDSEDGLIHLKHWLDNHMIGDTVGGLASFYSSSPWNTTLLAEGTPEAGRHVITGFIGQAGHASTIVGYNDSIRYDYNGDGLYTNDVDINEDGSVDLKDWEIGGLKFTDSYLGGNTWADSGFCYMMYNTLAREVNDGGVWNQAVHIVKVKPDYEPQLALKVNLEHNCRYKLKVMAGISSDINAIEPEYITGYPIFNYQGACQYMQGGNEPEALNLEFGIDITPLLGHVESGKSAKVFLLVDEDDPAGWGTGQILELSLMDYTQGFEETPYPLQNVPLIENGLTLLGIEKVLDFNELKIVNTDIPLAYTTEPYAVQLLAEGGQEPYLWSLKKPYQTTYTIEDYPFYGNVVLTPPDTIHSYILQKLDFEFPFYGKSYDSIFMHTDGFLMFDEQEYPWPYMHDEALMLRSTNNISPFLNFWLKIDTSLSDAMWYEGSSDYAAFRWKVSSDKLGLTDINFTVVLFPDGQIDYYYGSEDIFVTGYWASGISNGDGTNYKYLHTAFPNKSFSGTKISLIPGEFPSELEFSIDGLLSGTPFKNYEGIDLEFEVKDYNNLVVNKTFKFYSYFQGVEETKRAIQNIHCYPNPIKDKIQIAFFLAKKMELSFDFVDIYGDHLKLFKPKTFNPGEQNVSLDLTGINQISPGVYYLRGYDQENIIFTRKIVYMAY